VKTAGVAGGTMAAGGAIGGTASLASLSIDVVSD
jgi:hypothetical protein